MVIRELLIRLGLNGGAQVNRELDKVDGGVNKTMQSFSALGSVMAGVFAGLTLKSILDTADHMQSLEFRLGQMITSANGGTEALENLAQHARESRVDIESYAEAYTGIGAATHELIHTEQDLLKVTDSVAKGLQLAGASTQQTTSVMMQLTQAIAVGKLQWADMRIIMQNSDAFALRIAKSMGMTLNQMVQATQGNGGGIGADKLVNALRSMSDEVNAEFKQMPLTFTQGLTIIGTRWDMFVHRLNRSTGAVTWIADKFLWFADKVEFSLDRVVEALGGAENAVKLLGVALGAAGLIAGVWALRAAFVALASPITLAITSIALIYLLYREFVAWSEGRPSVMEDIFGDYNDYKDGIEKFKDALVWVKDAVGGWQTIFEAFAVYLAGKWLTRVLATLGIATKAATTAGAAIATAGSGAAVQGSNSSGKVAGGFGGLIAQIPLFSSLAKLGEGAIDSSVAPKIKGASWYPDLMKGFEGVVAGVKSATPGDFISPWNGDATGFNPRAMLPKPSYLGNPIGGVGGIPSIDYKPNINLTVNTQSDDPQAIANAVKVAMGDQAREFISGIGNTMNFNTGG